MHHPDRQTFHQLVDQQPVRLVPVYRQLVSDTWTPVTAFEALDDGRSACLFESVIGGEKVGRYSIVAADPFLVLSARRRDVTLRTRSDEQTFASDDPLNELRQHIARYPAAHLEELPPFTGGAIGYAGYDVIRYVEHLPTPPEDDRNLPDMWFGLFDQLVVFDNVNKTVYVIAMARLDEFDDADQAYEDACCRIDKWVGQLASNSGALRPTDIDIRGKCDLAFESNTEQAAFEASVRKCVEYIEAGDIFQVVISQRLEVPLKAPPFEVYRTLRVVNPSPFMFFVRADETILVGSSPEIMCRVVDGKVTVRPLAGTRQRGLDEQEDQRLAEELLADPKERAEHVMLVDLGRNDVGRVARFGTVELSDVMVIERYSHVMHITSNVTGQLREECDAFDALAACLPAGTVSGAPKVRAMEIIDELEPHRRGPYAGAVGYVDYRGNMDTCIALRTMVIQNDTAYIQAGAGIVADSVPENEYLETLNKARGLLKAVEITQARVSAHRTDKA
ncbi:MAG: anthranilate synthase component I [Pirellulaceae bacterium]